MPIGRRIAAQCGNAGLPLQPRREPVDLRDGEVGVLEPADQAEIGRDHDSDEDPHRPRTPLIPQSLHHPARGPMDDDEANEDAKKVHPAPGVEQQRGHHQDRIAQGLRGGEVRNQQTRQEDEQKRQRGVNHSAAAGKRPRRDPTTENQPTPGARVPSRPAWARTRPRGCFVLDIRHLAVCIAAARANAPAPGPTPIHVLPCGMKSLSSAAPGPARPPSPTRCARPATPGSRGKATSRRCCRPCARRSPSIARSNIARPRTTRSRSSRGTASKACSMPSCAGSTSLCTTANALSTRPPTISCRILSPTSAGSGPTRASSTVSATASIA